MKDTIISKYRSEVIEKSINIEWLMSAIISQRYFSRVVSEFLFQVLYDEYFSFALKRRILLKIVEDFDKQKEQDLNRANTIRNYFAHLDERVILGSAFPRANSKTLAPDPRKPDRTVDFEKLYNEFIGIAGTLEKYLCSIFLKMGGEMYDEKGKLISSNKDK